MTRAALAVPFSVLLLMAACRPDPVAEAPDPAAAPVPLAPAVPPPPPPPPPAPDAAPKPAIVLPDGMLEITLRAGGIKVRGKTVSLASLTSLFERLAAQDPGAQVLVRVEGGVSRARVQQIMSAAEGAGLSRIGTMDVGGGTAKKKKRKR